jgi:hypothetical protein
MIEEILEKYDTYARCSLKIAKSTDAPPWAILEDKGG